VCFDLVALLPITLYAHSNHVVSMPAPLVCCKRWKGMRLKRLLRLTIKERSDVECVVAWGGPLA